MNQDILAKNMWKQCDNDINKQYQTLIQKRPSLDNTGNSALKKSGHMNLIEQGLENKLYVGQKENAQKLIKDLNILSKSKEVIEEFKSDKHFKKFQKKNLREQIIKELDQNMQQFAIIQTLEELNNVSQQILVFFGQNQVDKGLLIFANCLKAAKGIYQDSLAYMKFIENTINACSTFAMKCLPKKDFGPALAILFQCNKSLNEEDISNYKQDEIVLSKLKCRILNNLGCCYRRMNRLKKAIMHLDQAVSIVQEQRIDDWAGQTYLNICSVASQLDMHEKALEYANLALAFCQDDLQKCQNANENGNETAAQNDNNNENDNIQITEQKKIQKQRQLLEKTHLLAIAYFNKGHSEMRNKCYQAAMEWFSRAVGLLESRTSFKNWKVLSKFKAAYNNAKNLAIDSTISEHLTNNLKNNTTRKHNKPRSMSAKQHRTINQGQTPLKDSYSQVQQFNSPQPVSNFYQSKITTLSQQPLQGRQFYYDTIVTKPNHEVKLLEEYLENQVGAPISTNPCILSSNGKKTLTNKQNLQQQNRMAYTCFSTNGINKHGYRNNQFIKDRIPVRSLYLKGQQPFAKQLKNQQKKIQKQEFQHSFQYLTGTVFPSSHSKSVAQQRAQNEQLPSIGKMTFKEFELQNTFQTDSEGFFFFSQKQQKQQYDKEIDLIRQKVELKKMEQMGILDWQNVQPNETQQEGRLEQTQSMRKLLKNLQTFQGSHETDSAQKNEAEESYQNESFEENGETAENDRREIADGQHQQQLQLQPEEYNDFTDYLSHKLTSTNSKSVTKAFSVTHKVKLGKAKQRQQKEPASAGVTMRHVIKDTETQTLGAETVCPGEHVMFPSGSMTNFLHKTQYTDEQVKNAKIIQKRYKDQKLRTEISKRVTIKISAQNQKEIQIQQEKQDKQKYENKMAFVILKRLKIYRAFRKSIAKNELFLKKIGKNYFTKEKDKDIQSFFQRYHLLVYFMKKECKLKFLQQEGNSNVFEIQTDATEAFKDEKQNYSAIISKKLTKQHMQALIFLVHNFLQLLKVNKNQIGFKDKITLKQYSVTDQQKISRIVSNFLYFKRRQKKRAHQLQMYSHRVEFIHVIDKNIIQFTRYQNKTDQKYFIKGKILNNQQPQPKFPPIEVPNEIIQLYTPLGANKCLFSILLVDCKAMKLSINDIAQEKLDSQKILDSLKQLKQTTVSQEQAVKIQQKYRDHNVIKLAKLKLEKQKKQKNICFLHKFYKIVEYQICLVAIIVDNLYLQPPQSAKRSLKVKLLKYPKAYKVQEHCQMLNNFEDLPDKELLEFVKGRVPVLVKSLKISKEADKQLLALDCLNIEECYDAAVDEAIYGLNSCQVNPNQMKEIYSFNLQRQTEFLENSRAMHQLIAPKSQQEKQLKQKQQYSSRSDSLPLLIQPQPQQQQQEAVMEPEKKMDIFPDPVFRQIQNSLFNVSAALDYESMQLVLQITNVENPTLIQTIPINLNYSLKQKNQIQDIFAGVINQFRMVRFINQNIKTLKQSSEQYKQQVSLIQTNSEDQVLKQFLYPITLTLIQNLPLLFDESKKQLSLAQIISAEFTQQFINCMKRQRAIILIQNFFRHFHQKGVRVNIKQIKKQLVQMYARKEEQQIQVKPNQKLALQQPEKESLQQNQQQVEHEQNIFSSQKHNFIQNMRMHVSVPIQEKLSLSQKSPLQQKSSIQEKQIQQQSPLQQGQSFGKVEQQNDQIFIVKKCKMINSDLGQQQLYLEFAFSYVVSKQGILVTIINQSKNHKLIANIFIKMKQFQTAQLGTLDLQAIYQQHTAGAVENKAALQRSLEPIIQEIWKYLNIEIINGKVKIKITEDKFRFSIVKNKALK